MDKDAFLISVLHLYEQSVRAERFNGVRLEQLRLSLTDEEIQSFVATLVTERKLDCLGPGTLNPHIKRFPPPELGAAQKTKRQRKVSHLPLPAA